MASIRKSFSFRNGVQVDEDNFIVNANGLVGIGTSIPNEALDVRGTAKVVGLTTTNDLFVAGVATAIDIKVGTAISITGGGIKAANFYGDGSTLSSLPTSQWVDVDVGLGYTSIFAAGNVGIATTDPRNSFQVGGTPGVAGKKGVGISSIGNIRATGIVTATSFVGPLTGDVTGDVTGDLTGAVTGNVTGNITGNVDGNVNSTGVSTFTTLSASLVNVGTSATFTSGGLDITGVTTATSFVGPVTGDVNGNVTGNLTGDVVGDINSGVTTATTELNVGVGGTALTSLNTGRVGIGSAIPKSDLTIKKANDASLEIVGESGLTKVSLGKSDTDGDESALIRYGNPDGSLNFVNYNAGSVNSFIHAGGGTGIQTGRFSWIYGQNNAELLSLTHEGKLGVGKTNPESNFEVVGTSTVTSNFGVGGDLDVAGDINLVGDIALPSLISGSNIDVNTGVSTFNNIAIGGTTKFDQDLFAETSQLFVNKIGVETGSIPDTTFAVKIAAKAEIDYIGIGTTASPTENMGVVGYGVGGGGNDTSNGLHLFSCKVGINSSSVYIRRTDISTSGEVTLSMGSTNTKAIIDFSDAGKGDGSALNPGISTARFMLPPIVTNAERVGLTTVAGGIVYNSSLNKLQNFDGTTWTSLGGGGSSTFTGLSDTPGSFTASKFVAVNSSGNALEFVNNPNTDTDTFTGLTDTPGSFTARRFLRVNSSGNALEYGAINGIGEGAVNVKDYGAVGNGTTDDRQAIINAISALGTDGGTVYFPPGHYRVSSQIEISGSSGGDVASNCIRFEGLGSPADGGFGDNGGSEIRADAGGNYHLFYLNGAEAVHFVNLRFRGGDKHGNSGTGSNSTAHALIFERQSYGGNDHLLENLVFVGMTACVKLRGTSRTTFRKVRIGHCPNGNTSIITLEESDFLTGADGQPDSVHKNRIDQTRLEGVVVDAAPDADNDSSRNSGANGLGMFGFCNTVFVKDSSFIRCNYGVLFDSTLDPAAGDSDNNEGEFFYFQNTEVERARLDGWSIAGGEFISLDNCFASSCDQNGIRILNTTSTSVNITNPNVRDNAGHGIRIESTTLNNCSIVNPSIGGNSRGSSGTNHGIFIENNVSNIYIAGGKIGGDAKLTGSATQNRGVLINGATHSNIRIIGTNVLGNTLSATEGIGAAISSGTGNTIKFNAGSTVDIDT